MWFFLKFLRIGTVKFQAIYHEEHLGVGRKLVSLLCYNLFPQGGVGEEGDFQDVFKVMYWYDISIMNK